MGHLNLWDENAHRDRTGKGKDSRSSRYNERPMGHKPYIKHRISQVGEPGLQNGWVVKGANITPLDGSRKKLAGEGKSPNHFADHRPVATDHRSLSLQTS